MNNNKVQIVTKNNSGPIVGNYLLSLKNKKTSITGYKYPIEITIPSLITWYDVSYDVVSIEEQAFAQHYQFPDFENAKQKS